MKANELSCKDFMIGDWVEPHQCRIPTVYCKVEGIYPDGTVNLDKAERLFTLDELEPIPLTPEILEKNGWVYIAEDKVFYSENFKGELPWIYYITDGSNEVFRMQDFCNLQYVHQLQHALRLCGINHEIIL